MTKALSFILTITLLILFKFSYANDNEKIESNYPYKQFSTLAGLPSNETYYTFQDNDGYIWISTDKGVSRYNGYEFENFTTADGLIDNTIFQMTQDIQGRIWFVGFNTKLCYYENYSFHEYEFNDVIQSHNELELFNSIEDFGIDENNNVFVGFKGYGYIIINNKGAIIESKSSKSRNFICGSDFNPNNGIIQGKKYFNGKYYDYSIRFITDHITNFYLVINDTVVQSFLNIDIHHYNKLTDTNVHINANKSLKTYIVNDSFSLYKLVNLSYTKNIKLPFTDNIIQKLYYIGDSFLKVDENGIWNLDSNFNNTQKILDFNKVNINYQNIISLQEIKGNLWVNTNKNGVYLIPNYKSPYTTNYRITNKLIVGIINQNNSISFKKEQERSSFYLDENNILRNTLDNILNIKDISKGNYSFYGKTALNNYSYNIKCISKDTRTFYSDRQNIYEFTTDSVFKLTNQTKSNIFSLNHYNGQLLVGTQNGIMYLNSEDKLSRFTIPKIDLVNQRIQDMKTIGDYLIIATRGDGLFITNQKKTVHFSVKEGLASNIINQLFVDEAKNLWVATNNGVNTISIKNIYNIEVYQHINLTHGIMSPDIRQIYIDKNIAYLACDIGLSMVKYKEINSAASNTPVFFRNLIINENVITKNKLNDTILTFSENSLLFRYTGITPIYSGNLIYRFKLVGLEKEWKYTKDRFIRYNSLKPGNYTFIVQARNGKNNWSNIHPEFNFKITQPYWRNPFFIAFVIIASLAISYAFIGYYIWSEKNRNKLLKELNKIKQESLNAQMNPHFVFNSLNSIQSFILKNDKTKANKYLVKFSKLMRLTFENSKSQYVNLEDEINALSLYLDLEQMRFDESFTYEIDIDPAINKDACIVPTLLMQPFVENAIWHGIQHKENGIGEIKITIVKDNDKLTISIEDNGVGFDKANTNKQGNHESSGIAITKKRLDLVNELEKNNYTCDIINLTNEFNKPIGTLVKFTIPYIQNINEKN